MNRPEMVIVFPRPQDLDGSVQHRWTEASSETGNYGVAQSRITAKEPL